MAAPVRDPDLADFLTHSDSQKDIKKAVRALYKFHAKLVIANEHPIHLYAEFYESNAFAQLMDMIDTIAAWKSEHFDMSLFLAHFFLSGYDHSDIIRSYYLGRVTRNNRLVTTAVDNNSFGIIESFSNLMHPDDCTLYETCYSSEYIRTHIESHRSEIDWQFMEKYDEYVSRKKERPLIKAARAT